MVNVFKVWNEDINQLTLTCSQSTIGTLEKVNAYFEHISYLFLVLLLLI